MNKNTLIIYAIIVGIAILSSVIKKLKRPGNANQNNANTNYNQANTNQYKKPVSRQPKSLDDILQSLLGEQKPKQTYAPKKEEKMVFTDKEPDKYTTLEEIEPLEKLDKQEIQYYNYDTELNYKEEMVDYDKSTDHHIHSQGLVDIDEKMEMAEIESEWAEIDWRKAIITAEILKRPQY